MVSFVLSDQLLRFSKQGAPTEAVDLRRNTCVRETCAMQSVTHHSSVHSLAFGFALVKE